MFYMAYEFYSAQSQANLLFRPPEKLPGVQGLRVDMLTSGEILGAVVAVPEPEWCAQTVPFYDYLLKDPEPAAILAGGIPVKLPLAARFVWLRLPIVSH